MFGKQENKKTPQAEGGGDPTIFATGTVFTGKMETTGDLRIDGKFDGDLISKAKVALGPQSEVTGNVTAENAEIEGKINGILRITGVLTLKATAVVEGEIYYGKIVMQLGARFVGKSDVISQNGTAAKTGKTYVSKNNAQKTKQLV